MLVRHGRTAWNAAGRYQGHADVELDGTGRAQARAAAAALAGLPVARVASSDLRRARATAAAVAAAHGLDVVVDARLREVDLGGWEGLRAAEAAERFPDEWSRWSAGEDVPRGGGESLAAAGRRALPALVALLRATPPGRVGVAVAHGYVLQAAADALAAAGVVAALPGGAPHLGNGEVLELEVRPAGGGEGGVGLGAG